MKKTCISIMEQMTQELNIDNYGIVDLQKLFSTITQNNIFYNSYTLMDVEEAKKKVYLELLRKYNYQHKETIQSFIDSAANTMISSLFQQNEMGTNTEMVGVKNVIKDPRKLNKNYFNETFRIISIDSMYREKLWHNNYEYDPRTSTNMVINLNDKLDSVVGLELTNVNIPFTFYNIDEAYGNNYFYVEVSGSSIEKISISSGNYDNATLVSTINDVLTTAGITTLSFTLNTLSNKVEVSNTGNDTNLIFYDHLDSDSQSFSTTNNNDLSPQTQAKINNNLGWILGFRSINYDNMTLEYVVSTNSSITSESLCYIPYTKYFVIVLDDNNKNQTNKGLVQISQEKEFIKRSTYFKEIDNSLNCLNDTNCSTFSNNNLTQKQIYSNLQINNYREQFKTKNSTLDATGINNVFGIIPFENKSLVWGESMFTSDKNRFKRKYTGPVDISKMHIKLLDDKGNLINLNGCEWSLTLVSTHLYQY